MAIGLPSIEVVFKGKANTAISRSGKGIACLIIQDTTTDTRKATYKGISEVKESDYTAENYAIISDTFLSDLTKLIVIRIGASETFADITKDITKEINWIAYVAEAAAEQKKLADFVKLENKTRVRRLKAVCFKLEAAAADDMHIVNFTNATVEKVNGGEISGHLYLGRLMGVLAACRLDQSVTYVEFVDLVQVAEVTDTEAAIGKGQFVLINDDDAVRIARGVNSLQKSDEEHTEDMKFITIVEGMDLLYEDVVKTFKESYIGRFKNSYDNQVLLISAINSYFRSLIAADVLDGNFENTVEVDIEKQRELWIANGKVEAEAWTEKQVKNMTFRTNVFLTGQVKFLNAIEDMSFIVEM